MVGQAFDQLLARLGYRLLSLNTLEQERRAAVRVGQANDAVTALLWGKIGAVRKALDESRAAERRWRETARLAAEAAEAKSQAEAGANARNFAELWGRLGVERDRAIASRKAELEAHDATAEAKQKIERLRQRIERLTRNLAEEAAARAAAQSEAASLRDRPRAEAAEDKSARLREKLEIARANAESLKVRLQSEHKKSSDLARQLAAAKAAAKKSRLDAQRAMTATRDKAAEWALTHAFSPAGDRSQDAPASPLGRRARSRAKQEDDAARYFQLGKAFQAHGSVGQAVAAYRKVGPSLKEFLVEQGPDGDRITGPDFIVIGAARSGTTWIKKCLSHHRQVFILSGEHHYFSTSSHMGPETYVRRFSSPHTRFQRPGMKSKVFARPFGRLYGEKSASYLSMPDTQIDLCAALFPDVRLICLVREPVARVWSHLKHLRAHGRLRVEELGDLPGWVQLDELIRQTRYEEHLARWAQRFDPRQMLLIDFDRIAREPVAVHDELLRHIGADAAPPPADLGEIGGTERQDMPAWLDERLRTAFESEQYDIPHLQETMAWAAAEVSGRPQRRREA